MMRARTLGLIVIVVAIYNGIPDVARLVHGERSAWLFGELAADATMLALACGILLGLVEIT
jgi:hypothetical protein